MRLTDRIVRQLEPPASGNQITYDAETKGFGCRVTAGGSRAFVLNYRRKSDGRERRFTIGSFPTVAGQTSTLEVAPGGLRRRSLNGGPMSASGQKRT
jgi:hypothetical protein